MTGLPNVGLGAAEDVVGRVVERTIRLDRRVVGVILVRQLVPSVHERAVVGCEDYQRAVALAGVVNRLEHPPDSSVHLHNEVAVRTEAGPALELLDGPDRLVRRRQRDVQQERLWIFRLSTDKLRGLPHDFVQDIGRRNVGSDLAGPHEPRKLQRRLTAERMSGDVPVPDEDVRREVQRCRDYERVLEAVRVRPVRHWLAEIEFAVRSLGKSQAQVPLPYDPGPVAMPSEEGTDGLPAGSEQRFPVSVQNASLEASPPRVTARQQSVPRRSADPRRGMRVDEGHASGRECVEIGGRNPRVGVECPDVAESKVVGQDDDHIRRSR